MQLIAPDRRAYRLPHPLLFGAAPAVTVVDRKQAAGPYRPNQLMAGQGVVSTEFNRLCTPSAEVESDSIVDQVARISDVAAGKVDGDAFFRRNHFTEGLGRLVATGFERLAGKSDSGAFYLTQAMGGGKTHSLIAMALLASDPALRKRVVPDLAAKHDFQSAKVIAFDGHNSPTNFLWGNIADQLGRPEAMQRFWATGAAAPGVDDWVATIGTDEPVLILLDELPSYLQMATGQMVEVARFV